MAQSLLTVLASIYSYIDILDFSKIESGRKNMFSPRVTWQKVIADVLSSYRYQIANSGFDIQTNIQPDLPPVLMDHDAMAQAISNLLDNAIKYSGEVKQLSITAETVGADLRVEIADRGMPWRRSK